MCLFCGIFKYIIYNIGRESFEGIRSCTLWTIAGLDLWFIRTIWVFYLISPFLYNIVKKHPLPLCIIIYIICLLTTLLMPEVTNNVAVSINRLPVFILGMIFAVRRLRINKTTFFISIVLLLLAMVSTIITTKGLFHFGNNLWMFPILALGIPALVSLLSNLIKRLWIGKNILKSIGKHSLELYLWHEFVFACLCVTLNKYVTPVVVFLIAFITTFILAYLSSICVDYLSLRFLRKNGKKFG